MPKLSTSNGASGTRFNYYCRHQPMTKLVRFALLTFAFVLGGAAFGQSNLPACQGSDVTRWSHCFGIWNDSNGDKYIGEFKNGQRNGQGIISGPNGKLKETGIYKGGTLSARRHIDPNTFIRTASSNKAKPISDLNSKTTNPAESLQNPENRRICSIADGEDLTTHRQITIVNYCN